MQPPDDARSGEGPRLRSAACRGRSPSLLLVALLGALQRRRTRHRRPPRPPRRRQAAVEDEHDDEGIGDLQEVAAQLLVTADELGDGFTDVGYVPSAEPNVCGFALDEEHPPDVLVGVRLDGSGAFVVQQELRVYPSTEESAAAYDAAVAGTTCPPTVASLGDVAEEVGADAATMFSETSPTVEAITVIAVVSDTVVTFRIDGTPGESTGAAPVDPIDLAAFGTGKILAALEAG